MLCVPAVEWNWCKTQIRGGSLLGVASILHPVCVLWSWEKENPVPTNDLFWMHLVEVKYGNESVPRSSAEQLFPTTKPGMKSDFSNKI